MLDLTFLTDKQVKGFKELNILKKYGRKCEITDFAILLGGYVDRSPIGMKNHPALIISYENLGVWWTQKYNNNEARTVEFDGSLSVRNICNENVGARPAAIYSEMFKEESVLRFSNLGFQEVEYGEYPQRIVDKEESEKLEEAYNNGTLKMTNKSYTIYSRQCSFIDKFKEEKYQEYEANEEFYVRVIGASAYSGTFLSNGRRIEDGEVYWVKVCPITWLIDEKNDIVLSKYILFSGIPFNFTDSCYDFNSSDIKKFMDNSFSKEIVEKSCEHKLENVVPEKKKTEDLHLTDIDSLFEEAIMKMNDISGEKVKVKTLR